MKLELSEEALEYGRLARRAIEAAGGDHLVQRAETDPDVRPQAIASVLGELGAWELEPSSNPEELEAAASLCRAAGYWALPYPVAERLARPTGMDADGTIIVGPTRPAAAIGGLALSWVALTLDGKWSRATQRPSGAPVRKTAFVVDMDLESIEVVRAEPPQVALGLVLPGWTLLGMLDRAVELTSRYVTERQQFGQALSSFQGVQFQLTDAEVERLGLEELLKHALWSVQVGRPDAVVDALAARSAAIEAADVVLRVTHQLHGAIGFCDETVLSWVSRYSEPLRRLPLGLTATRAEMIRRLGRTGLAGLFGDGPGS